MGTYSGSCFGCVTFATAMFLLPKKTRIVRANIFLVGVWLGVSFFCPRYFLNYTFNMYSFGNAGYIAGIQFIVYDECFPISSFFSPCLNWNNFSVFQVSFNLQLGGLEDFFSKSGICKFICEIYHYYIFWSIYLWNTPPFFLPLPLSLAGNYLSDFFENLFSLFG